MSAEFDLDAVRSRLSSPDEEERRAALASLPEGWEAGVLPLLVEALGDESWRVRKEAVARLARWPDPEGAVPALIATLADDSNVGLRNAAVEALAVIGEPAVGPLATALEAGGEHRKFLVDALAAIAHPQSVAVLVRCIDDPDENVRAAAAEALGTIGGAEAKLALRKRLESPDLLAKLAALEALNRLHATLPASQLIPMLGESVLRRAALEALGNSGDPSALPHLLDGLADRGRGTRESAALALFALHAGQASPEVRARIEAAVRATPESACHALIAAVSADRLEVRKAAVTLLGWGRWPEALPRLVDALGDEELHPLVVRALVSFGRTAIAPLCELAREATSALRREIFALFPRYGDDAAAAEAALVAGLDDDDPEVAATAARALAEIGGARALDALFGALERGDEIVERAAAWAIAKLGARHYAAVRAAIERRGLEGKGGEALCQILGALGHPEDRPTLLSALRAERADLRRAAASALPALGPADESREALLLALADEDPQVRAAAAQALGALGDRTVVAAMAAATSDDDVHVRIAATRALGALGDPAASTTLRELATRADPAVAVHALEALGRLDPSDAAAEEESLLIEALGREDPELVKAAVRALTVRPTVQALEGLVAALSHARWDVRRLAAHGLGARAREHARAADALRARRGVEDDPLVVEAIEAALASV